MNLCRCCINKENIKVPTKKKAAPKVEEPKDSLKAVYDEYKVDPAFKHLRKGKTFVPGVGSRVPALILIGEAPGKDEDEQGKPFVGKSGQVLDQLLKVGLGPFMPHGEKDIRNTVFITNVIKWRPEDNRTPTAEEIEAAKPYLRREIALVAAKDSSGRRPIVCFLGKTAAMLKGKEFAKTTNRGTVIVEKGWRYAPLYHPAVALYDPKMLDLMKEHFKAICKQL